MKRSQLVSISKGNRKLGGVMNISTSPRTCCPQGVPCARQGCYGFKAYRLYPGTRRAWSKNERVAKRHPESYFRQIAARIDELKPRLFRWHVAGDILSTDYLHGMCRIACANPQTHFLAFTKAFDIVNRYEDHEDVCQPGHRILALAGADVRQSPPPPRGLDAGRNGNPHTRGRHRVSWEL